MNIAGGIGFRHTQYKPSPRTNNTGEAAEPVSGKMATLDFTAANAKRHQRCQNYRVVDQCLETTRA